ncbi:MAG: hypothetical protein GEU81_03645 [Nitriliruptorales bacterium]|nr:hypothetical protein [Nitriliruptorales bacterium]
MDPRDAAWNRVSEQFASLGESLRRHYEDETPAGETTEKARETVEDALRALGDAADRLATAAGNALRDTKVQQDAKDAAVSLVDALGVTFSTLRGQARERFDGHGAEEEWEQEPPPPDPSIGSGEDRPPSSGGPPPA